MRRHSTTDKKISTDVSDSCRGQSLLSRFHPIRKRRTYQRQCPTMSPRRTATDNWEVLAESEAKAKPSHTHTQSVERRLYYAKMAPRQEKITAVAKQAEGKRAQSYAFLSKLALITSGLVSEVDGSPVRRRGVPSPAVTSTARLSCPVLPCPVMSRSPPGHRLPSVHL